MNSFFVTEIINKIVTNAIYTINAYYTTTRLNARDKITDSNNKTHKAEKFAAQKYRIPTSKK